MSYRDLTKIKSRIFFCIKTKIFLRKVLVVREKVVPLHPLSGSDLLSTEERVL